MGPSALCENATLSDISVVEVQNQEMFANKHCGFWQFLQFSRDPLPRGRGAKTSSFFAIPAVRAWPSVGIVRVGSLALWSRVNLGISSRSARDRPQKSGCKVANWYAEYVPAAPAAKSQLLNTKVLREVCPRSSGCKVETFKNKSRTRSTSPQLRLQGRKVDSEMRRESAQ